MNIVFYLDEKKYNNWFNDGLNLYNLISISELGGLNAIKKNLKIVNLDKLNFYVKNDADNNWEINDNLLDINIPLIHQIFSPPYNKGFNIINTDYGNVKEYHIIVVQNTN